ncbi:MAG: beta strand repeat-containing protein, partial [Puniceicoccales bacterium]
FNATFSGDMSGAGTLNKTGGGTLFLPTGATRTIGSIAVTDGLIDHTGGDTEVGGLFIGSYSGTGSDGTFTLTDGTIDLKTTSTQVAVGSGSGVNTGEFNIDGGTLNLGDALDGAIRVDFYVGAFGSSGTATVNQTGGVVNKLSDLGVLHIGNQGTGVYNLSGGTLNIDWAAAGGGLALGRSYDVNAGNGTLNITGGQLNLLNGAPILIGGAGSDSGIGQGVVNQTGGVVSALGGANIYIGNYGTGTYNLDGGTLEVGGSNGIARGTGTPTANFNLGGGTLRVIESDLTVGSAINPALTAATTSTINTNGFNAHFNGNFSGTGNVNKAGAGKLTLAGTSNSAGTVNVDEGELTVTHSLTATAIVVAEIARLNTAGQLNAQVSVNGEFTTGDAIGLATVNGDLTFSSTSSMVLAFNSETTNILDRGVEFDAIDLLNAGIFTAENGSSAELVFNGAGSTVDYTTVFWDSEQTWLIVDSPNSIALASGGLTSISVSADSNGMAFSPGVGSFEFVSTGDMTGVNLVFTPVPEPHVYALLIGLASLTIVAIRRRKHS